MVSILAFISCASTTTIQAVDERGSVSQDVKIFVDGSYRGRGEVLHSDTKVVGSTTYITFRKDGCRSYNHNFSRSESLNVGALIGGIFLLIPLLWVMGYNPQHSYTFECESY